MNIGGWNLSGNSPIDGAKQICRLCAFLAKAHCQPYASVVIEPGQGRADGGQERNNSAGAESLGKSQQRRKYFLQYSTFVLRVDKQVCAFGNDAPSTFRDRLVLVLLKSIYFYLKKCLEPGSFFEPTQPRETGTSFLMYRAATEMGKWSVSVMMW